MSDQLKKNPTVPAPLPHNPVASTVLILHSTTPRRKAKQLKISLVQIQREGFASEVISYAQEELLHLVK